MLGNDIILEWGVLDNGIIVLTCKLNLEHGGGQCGSGGVSIRPNFIIHHTSLSPISNPSSSPLSSCVIYSSLPLHLVMISLLLLLSLFLPGLSSSNPNFCNPPPNPPPPPPPTCAILFFGQVKNIRKKVLPSIHSHVLFTNPSCDVYAHTYSKTSLTSKRNEEFDVVINSTEVSLLTDNYVMDTEADFLKIRNLTHFRQYFPQNVGWEYPLSIDNMIRQWHSIAKSVRAHGTKWKALRSCWDV